MAMKVQDMSMYHFVTTAEQYVVAIPLTDYTLYKINRLRFDSLLHACMF